MRSDLTGEKKGGRGHGIQRGAVGSSESSKQVRGEGRRAEEMIHSLVVSSSASRSLGLNPLGRRKG